jgi:hypothetical protein
VQLQALASQAVDPRRRRTAQHPAPRNSRHRPQPRLSKKKNTMFGWPAAMKATPI